jgi:hypothetical protein
VVELPAQKKKKKQKREEKEAWGELGHPKPSGGGSATTLR